MTVSPASPLQLPRRHPRWREHAIILALLLLGAALRLTSTGTVPAGLYHDEAQHGLDALRVLEDLPQTRQLPLYFEANNGREPAYIYMVIAAVALLGRSPLAVRLPAFFAGTLTLAATYDLARTLFSGPGQSRATARRIGRYALATLAVTFWHIHLSRVGFRAVLLPLFTALYLAQGVRAVRSGRTRHWIGAGTLYGASWYTYMAARFTPVAIAAFLIWALFDTRRRARGAHSTRSQTAPALRRGVAWAGATALLVLLPLGFYTLTYPDVVLARTGQVSIFSESIHQGRFWWTTLQHVLWTAGMYTIRGDRIWRHNLAWRPVWDPALGLAFMLGLGICLAGAGEIVGSRSEIRPRRREAGVLALILIWTAVMALPTLLAEDAPHFLRAVGVLPTAALIPAIGMAWLASALHRLTGRQHWGRIAPWVLLALGLTSTTYDYFVRYPAAPAAYTWFEGGAVELAGQLNALRGAGWDGTRMHSPSADPATPTLYIDHLLWDSWAALPFLMDESQAHAGIRFLPESLGGEVPAMAGGEGQPDGVVYAVWPYRNWEPDVLPSLPHPSYLQVYRGPLAQGDRDPEPFMMAIIIAATAHPTVPGEGFVPTDAVGGFIAQFEGGILLHAAIITGSTPDRQGGVESELCLWWESTAPVAEDYTVFVHYLRGGVKIAQHDGQPGLGHLRTTFWQPGDLVLDIHPLAGIVAAPSQDTVRLGFYDPSTGHNLRLLDEKGGLSDETALEIRPFPVQNP